MSTLSAAAVQAAMAQNSATVWLQLLTIAHPDITTVRLVNNPVNISSRGNVYQAFPFELPLPQDVAESLASLTLTISNVDRRLVDELRSISDPMQVTLEVITAAAPDTVELGPFTFDLVSATYNEDSISGRLSFEPILAEPFPAGSFTPQTNPGLFGRT